MRLSSLAAAAAILSLVAVPAFAAPAPAANPAAGLSLAEGGGQAESPAHSGGHGSTWLLVGLGAAAVVGAAVALGSNHHHHDNAPASN